MEPEGMVHALQLIRGFLTPQGILIDIHPTSEPPSISVVVEGEDHPVGWLQESDDFIEYTQADQALERAVSEHMYHLERQEVFLFHIYATSLPALKAYLATDWKDAIIPPNAERLAAMWLDRGAGLAEICIQEKIMITRLRPGRGGSEIR